MRQYKNIIILYIDQVSFHELQTLSDRTTQKHNQLPTQILYILNQISSARKEEKLLCFLAWELSKFTLINMLFRPKI